MLIYWCTVMSTYIFSQGIWLDVQNLEDPELKELAECLPSIVLQSEAPVTLTLEHSAGGRGGHRRSLV